MSLKETLKDIRVLALPVEALLSQSKLRKGGTMAV